MEEKLIELWDRFNEKIHDPVAAAILTFASIVAKGETKRTGLTVKEAAEYLGVCERTIGKLHASGALKFNKIGRAIRFNADDLDACLRHKIPPAEPGTVSPHLRHFQRKRPCTKT
jgi:excisionase family DNA binding protein